MQVYRINTIFLSRPAMAKVGATKAPATWAEFNELATAMKAAGIIPVANGGIRWDDGMKLEIALGGHQRRRLSRRAHAARSRRR